MPGILGLPAIPTAAELAASGVALEDHAAAQAIAIINHARQELVQPILDAVAAMPAQAQPILVSLAATLDEFVDRLSGATVDNAAGVSLIKFTIPDRKDKTV